MARDRQIHRPPIRSSVPPILLAGLLICAAWSVPQAASGNETQPSIPLPGLKDHAKEMRDSLYHRALDYLMRYRQDDLGQAVRLFNQILLTHPDFAPSYGGLAEGRALRYLWGWEPDPDQLKRGVAQGRKGVELGPEMAETHLGLGLALMASERYTPALAELDRAVELDPDSFRAHLYRGMLLHGLRRTGELGREVTRIFQLDSASAVAYSLLGDYYQDSHQYTLSRDSYLTASLLDQHLLWARAGLATAYQRGLNYGSAVKTNSLTARDFPEEILRCRIMQASLFVSAQYYEDALNLYQQIAESEKLSPPLLRRLILAGRGYALEKTGNMEKAEYYYNRLLEEFPEDFDGAVRDREVVSQGVEGLLRYYDGKGAAKRSKEVLERTCRHPGMSFKLYRALAERRQASGDLAGSVAVLGLGVASAPEGLDFVSASEASLRVVRGLAARGVSARAREAGLKLLENLEDRLSQDPSTTYVPYLNLARCEALLKRDPRVISHLQLALDKGFSGATKLAEDSDFDSLHRNPDFQKLTARP